MTEHISPLIKLQPWHFLFVWKKKTPAKEKQTQGFAPRPHTARPTAVHNLRLSINGSARVCERTGVWTNADPCGLQSKPSPHRFSQFVQTLRCVFSRGCTPWCSCYLRLVWFFFFFSLLWFFVLICLFYLFASIRSLSISDDRTYITAH